MNIVTLNEKGCPFETPSFHFNIFSIKDTFQVSQAVPF